MKRLIAHGLGLALTASITPAYADIYTWTDKHGTVNVSNVAPPEGTRLTNVTRTDPAAAARDAAAREAARQAEVSALRERVEKLTAQVEEARREEPPVVLAYAPPAAPSYTLNVVSAPSVTYASGSGGGGCDSAFGNCGGWGFWPGYVSYGPALVPPRGHKHRGGRGQVQRAPQWQIVPPLIPLPSRAPAGRPR